MGNETAKQPGQLTRPPVPAPKPPAGGKRTGGTGPEQAPGNPGPGTSPAGNPRTGTPDGTGKAPKEKLPGLATVNPTVPAPETPKKKQQRKPRKKKEEPTAFNADQLSALILSTSAIIGSRPGMEIWTLRPEEATQLATPIANMAAKSEKLQNMGEYADAIALVTASLVIFAPRAMVYHDQQKAKKIQKNGGVKLVRTDKEGKGGESSAKSPGPNAAHGKEPSPGILDAIPSTIF